MRKKNSEFFKWLEENKPNEFVVEDEKTMPPVSGFKFNTGIPSTPTVFDDEEQPLTETEKYAVTNPAIIKKANPSITDDQLKMLSEQVQKTPNMGMRRFGLILSQLAQGVGSTIAGRPTDARDFGNQWDQLNELGNEGNPESSLSRQYQDNIINTIKLDDATQKRVRGMSYNNLRKLFPNFDSANPSAPRKGSASTDNEWDLREQYEKQPLVKQARNVVLNFQVLDRLGSMKNAPAQRALIFSFMKSLDPQSTVREGEQAQAENARGIPDSIKNIYNNLLRGTPLTDTQVKEFLQVAKSNVMPYINSYKERTDYYRRLARDYGFDPERVAPMGNIADLQKKYMSDEGAQSESSTQKTAAQLEKEIADEEGAFQ